MDSPFFRGEEMTLCQIYFQSEAVYSCVSELGEMGVVQFKDLNPDVNAFQRRFVNEVRRCEEIERKIRYIEKEIEKEKDIVVRESDETCEAPKPKDMIALETKIDQSEHDLLEVNSNKDALRKNYLELIELRNILGKAAQFFEEVDNHSIYNRTSTTSSHRHRDHHHLLSSDSEAEHVSLLMTGESNKASLSLGFITGILKREKVPSFELMLWRFCRGNVFHRTADLNELIEDPQTGTLEAKTVFIIFFQGEQLKNKCKKICDGFGAKIYPCPETQRERHDMLNGVKQRLDELKTVLDQSLTLRHTLLVKAAENVRTWFSQTKKMKAIYHTMNMFQYDQKSAIAEFWAPVSEIRRIRDTLDKESKKSDSSAQIILNIKPTREKHPTFNRTNDFTSGFQNIVNAYGVPNYREINPAPFYTITFPFLFGVMFGDTGHGFIIVLVAALLIYKEAAIRKATKGNEIMDLFLGGRYIMLLMGIFSVYAGFIYNDIFAKSMNIFGSQWRVNLGGNFTFQSVTLDPYPYNNASIKMYSGTPYAIGMDPIWALAGNKITFTNTLKMKFSVIIGIMQMIFGLILGLKNHIYFRRKISIFFEFIPQIIFITFIFAYLCLMIFIKWIKYQGTNDKDITIYGTCAPNLLIELINMFFLKDGSINESTGKRDECLILYPGQHAVQTAFVIISMLCIPVMLFTKPVILYRRHKMKSRYGTRMSDMGHHNPLMINGHGSNEEHHDVPTTSIQIERQDSESNLVEAVKHDQAEDGDEHEGEFDMAEVFVEQTIHTIEYFLGCVSHTASYLRLWALSLAHAQLSEVLWTMLFTMGLKSSGATGPFMMFFIFQTWACITIGIMCVMEGLSAFLHALRLHWVEFQSKFYKGEGYLFVPFSFERIIGEEAEI